MAQPWVVGLSAGAGALAGLVAGGAAGMKLSENAATPDTRTAGIALGSAVGMFVGAFALGALVAEPGTGTAAPPGTAGIPKGLGALRSSTSPILSNVNPFNCWNWELVGIPSPAPQPLPNNAQQGIQGTIAFGKLPAQLQSGIDRGIAMTFAGNTHIGLMAAHPITYGFYSISESVFLSVQIPNGQQSLFMTFSCVMPPTYVGSPPTQSPQSPVPTTPVPTAPAPSRSLPPRTFAGINSQLSPRGVGRQSFLIPPRAPGPRGPSYPVAPPSSPPSSPPIPFCPEGGTLVVVNGQYQCVWPAGAS